MTADLAGCASSGRLGWKHDSAAMASPAASFTGSRRGAASLTLAAHGEAGNVLEQRENGG
ncbi:hypothetical protein JYU34_015216 [Plutella xylostella]|uniref:Uncharacterized protein n=1 Tax=Plutella xylostella TaxID=51655 RepID=A0ABQ7Q6X8_PLUXY|nr:hypothetical protein JYU34_015216 [Plutella xylostella]